MRGAVPLPSRSGHPAENDPASRLIYGFGYPWTAWTSSSGARKGRAYGILQQIEEQRTRYSGAYPTLNHVPEDNVDQVAQNLGRNNSYSQSPSPDATFEPTRGANGKSHSK